MSFDEFVFRSLYTVLLLVYVQAKNYNFYKCKSKMWIFFVPSIITGNEILCLDGVSGYFFNALGWIWYFLNFLFYKDYCSILHL